MFAKKQKFLRYKPSMFLLTLFYNAFSLVLQRENYFSLQVETLLPARITYSPCK
jgi:hypothetical protein